MTAMERVVTRVSRRLERGDTRRSFLMKTAIVALCRSVLRWYSPRGRLSPEQIGEYYARLVVSMVKLAK